MIYMIEKTIKNQYLIEADSKEEAERKYHKIRSYAVLNGESLTAAYGETHHTDAVLQEGVKSEDYPLFDQGIEVFVEPLNEGCSILVDNEFEEVLDFITYDRDGDHEYDILYFKSGNNASRCLCKIKE